MRVAVTLAGTDRGRSGLGTWVREVLPRLSSALRVEGGTMVVLGTARDLAAYDETLARCGRIERARVPSVADAPLLSAIWHLWNAGRLARSVGAEVLLLPAANRRSTARSSVPTVAVVHDLAQLRVEGKYDALRMLYARQVIPRALRTVSALVAVSGATRDDLVRSLGIDVARVRVVPNGVDAARFQPAAAGDPRVTSARARFGIEGPYLLYVARLEHPGKNHLRLLRAFAASTAASTHKLVFVGADWGGERLIRDELRRLGLDGRVLLAGYTEEALLVALVTGADAVAMVGLCEGFGLPALEALAAGRAVIVANTGALPEVVGPLGALCDPLDEASMRAAIERAIGDEELRSRASREGPIWAAARGWDRTAEGILTACLAARGS